MFPRVWCMPNRYTFAMPPVAQLLKDEGVGAGWADPMAGIHSPAHITNDIDPTVSTAYHFDALQFLKTVYETMDKVDGVVFDPPYSASMAGGKYANPAAWTKYILQCKDEIARIIRPGGKAILFGWNSNGLGMKRGFTLVRGLIIAHGGSHQHDTIITVEVKEEK